MKLPGLRTSLSLLGFGTALTAFVALQSCVDLPPDQSFLSDAGPDGSAWQNPFDSGTDAGDAAGDAAPDDAGLAFLTDAAIAYPSTTFLNFGTVSCGTTGTPLGFSIVNNSRNTVTYTAAVPALSSPFSVETHSASGTINPGENSAVLVDVTMGTGGLSPIDGGLVINVYGPDGGPELPQQTIALLAQPSGAEIVIADGGLTFVPTSPTAAVEQGIQVWNNGTEAAPVIATLDQSGYAPDASPPFWIVGDAGGDAGVSVAPDASVTVIIAFDPTHQTSEVVGGVNFHKGVGNYCIAPNSSTTIPLTAHPYAAVDAGADASQDSGTPDGSADATSGDAASGDGSSADASPLDGAFVVFDSGLPP